MTDGHRDADTPQTPRPAAAPPSAGTPPIFRPPPPPLRTSRVPAVAPEPESADADPRRDSYERLPALTGDATAPLPETESATRTERPVPAETAARPPESLPTDPVRPGEQSAADPTEEPIVAQWVHVVPERPREGLGGFALTLAILALVASFFVGWAAPVALVAVIVAAVALRRPQESRLVAAWALALGLLAFVYSAGWLLWTAGQLGMFGGGAL